MDSANSIEKKIIVMRKLLLDVLGIPGFGAFEEFAGVGRSEEK